MPHYVARFVRQIPQVVGSLVLDDLPEDVALQRAIDFARTNLPGQMHVTIELCEVTPSGAPVIAPAFRVEDDGTIRQGQQLDAPIVGHVERG